MALKETIQRLRDAGGDREEPAALVTRWQGAVSGLYDAIAAWLKPFVDDGGIILERRLKPMHEAATGAYEIERLDIEVGTETVRLDPMGTVVIGARGRIDMSRLGSGDPLFQVLAGPAEQPGWSIVQPSARSRSTPLTKESFETALDALLTAYDLGTDPRL
ncbi:hypothetical protein MKL09_01480 [Methylobacterium sp. J-048]|uniref:hypothetical protein n=1 Tax=Methylobacterium sp. J-048 TaxID=2836635 RepID=UPI001FBA2FB3|nr:hypothetical protein [Methylobacterium sp. J-048]MCJ2055218.1 hypothetical protein [Methylobacterium sp. J-048]